MNDLSLRDSKVIWHPYTQMKTAKEPIAIERGEGAYLFDYIGNKFIDAISSWWVNTHGHAHPHIAEKVSEQLNKLEHVIFAGFTHQPAVELAERLLKILPQNQKRVFYSDNGSTAVEVALKMAFQYWKNRGISRSKIVSFKNGYHGDTFGAMSISERSIFTAPFSSYLFEVLQVEIPNQESELELLSDFSELIEKEEVAAFIFEPLVQGAAGMLMYPAAILDQMIKICRDNEVLIIADEVFTGFGRTGKMFASDFLRNKADIFCLSKGLTGGTMPLGVTTASEDIYDAFLSDDNSKTFFHGHSFTANPIACTAALASLDIFEKTETWNNIERICGKMIEIKEKLSDNFFIKEIRVTGTILAIEIKTEEKTNYLNELKNFIFPFFIKKGIILRPLGNIIYLVPPYCILNSDLDYICDSIASCLTQLPLHEQQ